MKNSEIQTHLISRKLREIYVQFTAAYTQHVGAALAANQQQAKLKTTAIYHRVKGRQ